MKPARFRDDMERAMSDWALEALILLERIASRATSEDPLRDAALVGGRVLELALTASPLRRVVKPQTLLEQSVIPRGRKALVYAASVTPKVRKHLDEVRSATFLEKGTDAEKRRELIRLVVRCSRELHAELKSKGRAAKQGQYTTHLRTLLASADVTPAVCDVAYFGATMEQIIWAYSQRYRVELPRELVSRAVLASIQRAERGDRAGRVPRGALNHLRALEELIESAGLKKSNTTDLRRELRAAGKSYARHIAQKGYRRPFIRPSR